MKRVQKRRTSSKFTKVKRNIISKQKEQLGKNVCFYCKRVVVVYPKNLSFSATIDHIIPLSKGGVNARYNLCVACRECNNKKGDNIW